MKKCLITLLPLLLVVATPRQSEAKLVEIWGSALVGGASGDGNASSDRDFYNWASGGAGGFEVGAKVLFITAYVEYLRFFGGDTGANLLSLNLGGDSTITLSGGLKLVLRLAGSAYLGTLDGATRDKTTSTEVQTRGIGVRGGVGLRYEFAKVFSVGVTPQLGYHYFFGGAGDSVLDTDQNSSGYDFQALGYLRFALGL